MDKKQKEIIKGIVNAGLKQIMSKLSISAPSSKLETSLKKHTKKLIEDLKKEIKRKDKKKTKDSKQSKDNGIAPKKIKSVKIARKKATR